MAVPLSVVDSFTDRPFGGNPAGVVVLAGAAPEAWMRAVAAEVNLSETAFVVERDDGDHDLRWFTPTVEVDLCGHATLASAHVLGGTRRFHTRSGLLTCEPRPDGSIAMDLPGTVVTPAVGAVAEGWPVVLGLAAAQVLAVAEGPGSWLLAELAGGSAVRSVAPDLAALAERTDHAVLVVADTTGDDAEPTDSVARVFAPSAGIPEDPVTGSAHAIIGPWLAARHGRTTFTGHQASSRGGHVAMEVRGDRVVVSGHAVTVSQGSLLIDPS